LGQEIAAGRLHTRSTGSLPLDIDRARIEFGRVIAALEADADALADRHGDKVQQALGTAPPRTPLTEAMWNEDEECKAWQRQELERARQIAHRDNVDQLAAEVRE
jgi:hypothetical protein